MKKIIVLICLSTLLLTLIPLIDNAEGKIWYSTNWNYKKNCYISNNFLGYQQKITIGKSTGGNVSLGGHCNDNFSDIRFIHNNDTVLNHWMQNYTSGVSAIFWFNNTYNDSCISIYYGYVTAPPLSNGTLTFLLFDDFLGTGLNTTKWKTTGILNPNFRNSEMYVSTSGTNKYISTYKTFYQNTSVSAKVHYKTGERGDTIGYGINNPSPYYTPPNYIFNSGGSSVNYFVWSNNLAYSGSSTTAVTTVYKIYTLDRSGATRVIGKINGTILTNADSTTNTPRTAMNISIGKGAGSEQSNLTIDWVFVSTIRATKQSLSSFGTETLNVLNAPVNSNEYPTDKSAFLSYPILSITVSDMDKSSMNNTLRSNYTGTWKVLKYTNNTLNTTITYTGTYVLNKTIYWSSNTTDNTSRWDNDTYTFYVFRVPSTNISFLNNHINTTWKHEYKYNIYSGYTIYDNDTGNTSTVLKLYLFENILNATGFHNYTLNSTGYTVYANYTGNGTIDPNSTGLWIYLGAMLTLDNGQFFLLILIGLWSYFIYLYYREKEVIFSFCIICCGLPLGIILSGVAYYNSYPFGYLISFILILISFLIPTYGVYQKNKKKNKN